MGVSNSTLGGHRVTSARATIPAWGAWYADASVDGEVTLSGAVELKIADLSLKGTVLSGGPDKGRSLFRIVGGNGAWGKELPAKSYANDAGVKLSTVLVDAANEAGESLLSSSIPDERVGPAFVRPAGPACRVLEQLAPSGWYVGEDGVTRIGKRSTSKLSTTAARTSRTDLARGTVTLAAESIKDILPGVTTDGLEAVDVEHEISAKGGLRSTVWGKSKASTSRRLAAFRAILDQLDPGRAFRGMWEYRVVTQDGERLNLQAVRVSTGMPDLRRVPVRPGVSGCKAMVTLGSRVLVGFIDEDPGRPFVAAFEDAEGEGFVPLTLDFLAGGMVGGEHLMTTEATTLLLYNTLVALMAAAGGGPLLAAVLQPLIGAAITTALTAQAAPAPPGLAAQTVASAAQLPGFATGTVPATTSEFFASAIAALTSKTANVSGSFPSIGCKAVKGG